jgi:enoyl-CoA hydratase
MTSQAETKTYQDIQLECDEAGVATVTLNRPKRLNALNWHLMEELEHCLKRCEKDTAVHVIIIRGAGRCFSAGYDFQEHDHEPGQSLAGPGVGVADGTLEPRGVPEYGRGIWNSRAHVQGHIAYDQLIWNLWKPVIAQVHGYALAGGSTLALACDLTIMSDDAKIGYPPARWLASGDNSGIFSFVAGLKKAKELAFGELFDGKKAESIGMINYSFPADRLEQETRAIATRIASIEPELLMINKMMVNRTWEMLGVKTAMDIAGEFNSICHLSNTAGRFIKELQTRPLAEALKKLNEPWNGV